MKFRLCKHHSTKTDDFLKTSNGFDIRMMMWKPCPFQNNKSWCIPLKMLVFNQSAWLKTSLNERTLTIFSHNSQFPLRGDPLVNSWGSVLWPIESSPYITFHISAECQYTPICDDTLLRVHVEAKQEAAATLTTAVLPVSQWFKESCLHINTKDCLRVFLP